MVLSPGPLVSPVWLSLALSWGSHQALCAHQTPPALGVLALVVSNPDWPAPGICIGSKTSKIGLKSCNDLNKQPHSFWYTLRGRDLSNLVPV